MEPKKSEEARSSGLRRRNSIASTIPRKLDLPMNHQSSSFHTTTNGERSSSFSNVDFELVSIPSMSYTSLKDLLPSSPGLGIQSPTGVGTQSGYEISIRNRLVKQAAWAYLQPMATSPDSSGSHFFQRIWIRLSGEWRNPVNACFGFINRHVIRTITRAFERLLVCFGSGGIDDGNGDGELLKWWCS